MADMYGMYLRKSRKDLEAEARGEGETLARHKSFLLALAQRQGLSIGEIYCEIVSGDSIASRPEMQRLLHDVESGAWKGILTMEVERLARGDTIDQGIVAQTFKYSGTKIVTPVKTYDPSNEFDEEYFEFSLFMSRREYKAITRRIRAGMLASVQEGNYLGNIPPYGYTREKNSNSRGYSLVPYESEAAVVRQVFEWYVRGDGERRLGTSLIARKLNDLRIPARNGGVWVPISVIGILRNPVYIGKIRYKWRPEDKRVIDGEVKKVRHRVKDFQVFDGKHPAIISNDDYFFAQDFLNGNSPAPLPQGRSMTNPLSGLVVCGGCGRKMTRRVYTKKGQEATLLCPVTACSNVSAPFYLVESRVLDALSEWLRRSSVRSSGRASSVTQPVGIYIKSLAKLEADISDLFKQRASVFEYYERKVYDDDTFLERSQQIAARIEETQKLIDDINNKIDSAKREDAERKNMIPRVSHLIDIYYSLESAQEKNELLKGVIEKIIYTKTERCGRWGDPGNFTIDLYIKIPPAH